MKKTKIKRMPTLREAFVLREKAPCDDDEKEVKEALPPPSPGTVPGKAPPPPTAALTPKKAPTTGRAMTAGVSQYAQGIMSDVLGLEKDLQINKSKYVGLDIDRELKQVKTDADALKVKVDNWVNQQSSVSGVAPSAYGGNA